jgi:hypothetical protein
VRFREILREAFRNVYSGSSRQLWFMFFLSGMLGALVFFDGESQRGVVIRTHSFLDSGAATFVLEATGQIRGDVCDGLDRTPGIVAAGAVSQAMSPVRLSSLPATSVPTYDGSPGFTRMLTGQNALDSGILASAELLAEQARPVGAALHTNAGRVRIAGTYAYPNDGRRTGFEYSIVVPERANRQFDQCWVTTWPFDPAVARLTNLALTSSIGEQEKEAPVFGQLNSSLGSDFIGLEEYRSRPSRFAPVMALTVGAILGAVAIGLRRLSLASARHLGVRATDLSAITFMESFAVVVPAALAIAPLALWQTRQLMWEDAVPVLLHSAVIVLAGSLGFQGAVQAAIVNVSEHTLLKSFRSRV